MSFRSCRRSMPCAGCAIASLDRDIVSLKFVKDLRIDGGRVAFTIETDDAGVSGQGSDARSGAARRSARLPGVSAVDVKMTAQGPAGRSAPTSPSSRCPA